MDDCILLAATIHCETFHHARNGEDTQLDFTSWTESLKPMTSIVQVLAGLGVVTFVLGVLKYSAERRYWRRFKRRANAWVDRQLELKELAPESPSADTEGNPSSFAVFEDDNLTVVVEQMLTDAGFTPFQSQQPLSTSLLLVKGMAADKFLT
jgi:hypothetical protein